MSASRALIAADSAAVAEPAAEPATMSPAALYARHADTVARWVAHLAGPGADREALVHDVFVIALRRMPELDRARPTTWLYRVALNVVRNDRRRRKLRSWLSLTPEHHETVASPAPGPDEAVMSGARRALVYRALDRLPEKQRTVLVMFELEGMTGAEIAEVLGIRPATVFVQIHRARAAFAKALGALDGGAP